MKLYEEKIFFKKRDRTFYTVATRDQIYEFLDIYDFDMIKRFLEYMDYPWFPDKWVEFIMCYGETPRNLARYINYCNLKAILPLGYKDSMFIASKLEKDMFETTRKRMDPDYYGG